MPSTTSALLAIALIWPPTASNVYSAPAWQTLPPEQPLSAVAMEGYVDYDGARIWYGTAGTGEPVVLLHGGMESSLSWGNQVPALITAHPKVILIDSRGHGRSTLALLLRLSSPKWQQDWQDYARISPTPDDFGTLHQALETMQKKEPNYTTKELSAIKVSKIAIADGDHEEFITRAHTDYLAATTPGAKLIILPNVSHFAPWQDFTTFNNSIIRFLDN
jgi:pimeloyl-ACP methyl ester carboxylesterase